MVQVILGTRNHIEHNIPEENGEDGQRDVRFSMLGQFIRTMPQA